MIYSFVMQKDFTVMKSHLSIFFSPISFVIGTHYRESVSMPLSSTVFHMLSSKGFKVSDFILRSFIQFLFWYRMNMCLSYFLLMLKFSAFSKEQLYEGWIFPLFMFSLKFHCCDFILIIALFCLPSFELMVYCFYYDDSVA